MTLYYVKDEGFYGMKVNTFGIGKSTPKIRRKVV